MTCYSTTAFSATLIIASVLWLPIAHPHAPPTFITLERSIQLIRGNQGKAKLLSGSILQRSARQQSNQRLHCNWIAQRKMRCDKRPSKVRFLPGKLVKILGKKRRQRRRRAQNARHSIKLMKFFIWKFPSHVQWNRCGWEANQLTIVETKRRKERK